MKKKTLIISLITSVLLIMISISTIVYAAFMIGKSKGAVKFKIGKLYYELNGSIKSASLIYPGLELVIEDLIVSNKSTIDTEVRMKLYFKLTTDELEIIIDNNTFNDYFLNLSIGSNWLYNNDNYYYLNDNSSNVVGGTNKDYLIFDSLILDGSKVKNEFANAKLNLYIDFQARQSKNLNWETFDLIEF